MVKRYIFFFVAFLVLPHSVQGQYECQGILPPSVEDALLKDAQQITLRQIYQKQLPDTAEIDLPTDLVKIPLAALTALYQDQDLPHWEAVFVQYAIHTKEDLASRKIRLTVDTSQLWVQEWLLNQNGGFGSGTDLGNLLRTFKFSLEGDVLFQESAQPGVSDLVLTFISQGRLNLQPLLEEIKQSGLVKKVVSLMEFEEYTNDITMEVFDSYVEFLFSYGWDCFSGNQCNNQHFWRYRVYEDCQTEFIDDFGSTLQVYDLQTFISTGVFPNPTSDEISLVAVGPPDQDVQVLLYNTYGQIIHSEFLRSNTGFIQLNYSLKELPLGIYFLGLSVEGAVLTEKILKR